MAASLLDPNLPPTAWFLPIKTFKPLPQGGGGWGCPPIPFSSIPHKRNMAHQKWRSPEITIPQFALVLGGGGWMGCGGGGHGQALDPAQTHPRRQFRHRGGHGVHQAQHLAGDSGQRSERAVEVSKARNGRGTLQNSRPNVWIGQRKKPNLSVVRGSGSSQKASSLGTQEVRK